MLGFLKLGPLQGLVDAAGLFDAILFEGVLLLLHARGDPGVKGLFGVRGAFYLKIWCSIRIAHGLTRVVLQADLQ